MQKNRRNFSRVKFDSTAFINLGTTRIQAHLVDISLRGALVALIDDVVIEKGKNCQFEFHLNETEIVLFVNAMVVFSNAQDIGLKFDNIDLESMIHLRRLVELNIGDPDQIQKELFFLASLKS